MVRQAPLPHTLWIPGAPLAPFLLLRDSYRERQRAVSFNEHLSVNLEGDELRLTLAKGTPKGLVRGQLQVVYNGSEDVPIPFVGFVR